MLVIRPEQMKLFLDDARRRLAVGIAERLAAELPPVILNMHQGRLASRAAAGVRVAESFGLLSGESIHGFVTSMFLVGPQFFRYPPIADKLRHPAMNGQQRWEFVLATTSASQWKAAGSRATLEAWDQL